MTKTVLYAVISDQSLAQSIQGSVSDSYDLFIDNSIEDIVARMAESKPEIILCEQALLEPDQSVVLATLKTACPTGRILAVGPSRPIEVQVAALKYGARGYFDVSLPLTTLNAALAGIMRGEVWVERHVISELIDALVLVPAVSDQQRQTVESLSPKELEVAKLVSHGATNKMIAHQMLITERTVKAHLTSTFQKMNLPDRLSLAIFFRDLR
jgi:two-component system nitrate/nitrite response regulator NarL